MANCRLHAVRVFHYDAHCVQYAAADDEGERFDALQVLIDFLSSDEVTFEFSSLDNS